MTMKKIIILKKKLTRLVMPKKFEEGFEESII